ncbi:MAG: CU044_2847 family protein [Methanosarcina mazei]|mgnify:CR=1 FL=1|uniref:CU044_2847 family protein n=1 Tax=Methanosarcina soligelidi TaxID=1036677 RepID=UPI00064E6625|nr:CU044_2847 family protein [Methanosarcina soligelidi]
MNLKGIIDNNKNNNKDENQKSDKEPAKVRPILAELGHIPGTGTIKMTLVSAKAVEEKSISSINNTMILIKEFSRIVGDTIEEIPFEHGPSQVQLGFNILLTTDGKAVITKSEKEKSLRVTLTWKHEEKDIEKDTY